MRVVQIIFAAAIAAVLSAGISFAQDSAPVTAAAPAAPAEAPAVSAPVSPAAENTPTSVSSADTKPPAKSEAPATSPAQLLNFSQGSGPLKIKSDKMTLEQKQKMVVFSGHVHADRGDGELTCAVLRVVFTDEKMHDVSQIIADENVRISQGTRYATSDHAVMDQLKHTVVLTGNPVVHDGTDQIAGTRITVDQITGQSVVEGARAVIFPRRSENADNSGAVDHVR